MPYMHSFIYKQSFLSASGIEAEKDNVKIVPKSTTGDQPQFTGVEDQTKWSH